MVRYGKMRLKNKYKLLKKEKKKIKLCFWLNFIYLLRKNALVPVISKSESRFYELKYRKYILPQALHFSWLWQIHKFVERKWIIMGYDIIDFIAFSLLPIKHSICVNLCFKIITVLIITISSIVKFSCLGLRFQSCITERPFPIRKVSEKTSYWLFFCWQSCWYYCP